MTALVSIILVSESSDLAKPASLGESREELRERGTQGGGDHYLSRNLVTLLLLHLLAFLFWDLDGLLQEISFHFTVQLNGPECQPTFYWARYRVLTT